MIAAMSAAAEHPAQDAPQPAPEAAHDHGDSPVVAITDIDGNPSYHSARIVESDEAIDVGNGGVKLARRGDYLVIELDGTVNAYPPANYEAAFGTLQVAA